MNTAHNGAVSSLCYTEDGLHLISFGTDQRLRLWNTASGRNTLVNFGKVTNSSKKGVKMAVSCRTDPTIVFVPTENNIDAFNVHTGEQVTCLRGHYNRVNCCTFHAHTHELYSGGNDRCILTWVPDTDAVTAYQQHLRDAVPAKPAPSSFTRRIAATADTWSSDDD